MHVFKYGKVACRWRCFLYVGIRDVIDVCGLMGLAVSEWVRWTERLALGAGLSRDVASSAFCNPAYSEIPLVPAHTPAHGNAETPPNTHSTHKITDLMTHSFSHTLIRANSLAHKNTCIGHS